MHRYALRLLLAFAVLAPASTSTGAAPEDALVLPPDVDPFGESYSDLAALWWQWAAEQPTNTNPLLDKTGKDCANEQEGKFWLLAGLSTSGTVERSCTVPADKAVLFPIINFFYCVEPDDPPKESTVGFARRQVSFVREAASGLYLKIDGVPVTNLEDHFVESSVFTLTLPKNNIFKARNLAGVPLTPCVDAGYYVVLEPLEAGEHIIEFGGALDLPGEGEDFEINVTYEITVE